MRMPCHGEIISTHTMPSPDIIILYLSRMTAIIVSASVFILLSAPNSYLVCPPGGACVTTAEERHRYTSLGPAADSERDNRDSLLRGTHQGMNRHDTVLVSTRIFSHSIVFKQWARWLSG